MRDLSTRLRNLPPEQQRALRERLEAGSRTVPGSAAPENRHQQWSLFFFAASQGREASQQYQLMLDCARFADTHGFDAIWIPERHFDPFGAPYPSPAVLAGALAAVTRRLKIRAGSVVLPLHDPIRVAEDWAVVDNISAGRIGLSFASGWHSNDFVFAPAAYSERKQVLVDHLRVVRQLLAGESIIRVDGAGEQVSLRTYPRALQADLPIWITSSLQLRTWLTGAELGLNVLTGLVEQSVDELADKASAYRKARVTAGHDPDHGIVTAMIHTFIGESPEQVRAAVRDPLTEYLRAHIDLYSKDARNRDLGIDVDQVTAADKDTLASMAFERYFTSHGLFGTPQSALAMVGRLRAAGVDEIACLVDFGLSADVVLAHLEHLAQLRELSLADRVAKEDQGYQELR